MSVLFSDPYCQVVLDPAGKILRFVRTEVPYASLADVEKLHQRVGRVLDLAGREQHALLVDMRAATLNNRPGFEQAGAHGRTILVRGFARVAVLVETAVGALQVRRHMREDGVPGEAFHDEAEAVAYLKAGDRLSRVDLVPEAKEAARFDDGPFGLLSEMMRKR